MSGETYTPPAVWKWNTESCQAFADINRPTAGAQHEAELPVGRHPLQLYSLATPNGVKVTIMLEELLAAGVRQAEYDAWLIDISKGDQFSSGFVFVNPNSKIPALVDRSVSPEQPVFESGSILLYLSEKFEMFMPTSLEGRTTCLNWLFWQMSATPLLGGGFGHFYAYAPEKIEYAIDRFTLEVKRQLDVLDQHLCDRQYICGDFYSIADIAIWPWYGALVKNQAYNAAEFLEAHRYEHLARWVGEVNARPAVKRGLMVNRTFGKKSRQLWERHDASDFELRTQNILDPDDPSTHKET